MIKLLAWLLFEESLCVRIHRNTLWVEFPPNVTSYSQISISCFYTINIISHELQVSNSPFLPVSFFCYLDNFPITRTMFVPLPSHCPFSRSTTSPTKWPLWISTPTKAHVSNLQEEVWGKPRKKWVKRVQHTLRCRGLCLREGQTWQANYNCSKVQNHTENQCHYAPQVQLERQHTENTTEQKGNICQNITQEKDRDLGQLLS